MFEADDRRDLLVNLGFVALIVVLALGLVFAIGLSYYDSNLRPLARVGGYEISPALVRDRMELDRQRFSRDEGRLRTLHLNNEIDLATLSSKTDDLNSKSQQLTADTASEELIDLVFQGQLAAGEGVAPSDADITAAVDREFSTPERRHILLIAIKPELDSGATRPTVEQRKAAADKAQQALDQLQAGADWATVAAQFSDDPSAASGGDGGTISADNPSDAGWVKAIFAAQQGGTTRIVGTLGCSRPDAGDCEYRIGRVTEITPGSPDTAYRDKVMAKLSADRVREIVGWEAAADRLRDTIIARATSGTVDQIHLGEIVIRDTESTTAEGATPDPVAAQGEVHYSQILFAPGDDPQAALKLPATDPAWATALSDATAAYNVLNAITDSQARSDKFAEIAKASSDDDASKADGGDIAFSTREALPVEVAKVLFDNEHQNGDLIAPVKDESGYYVLLFHERRGTPQQRLEQLKTDIAANVDWNSLVDKYSDAEAADKANGGDIGWFSRDMLKQIESETVDKLFALQAGQVSEPITFGTDSLVFKAFDHVSRELDPNQLIQLSDPDFGAFADWYSDKKTDAETNKVITRATDEALPVEQPTDTP